MQPQADTARMGLMVIHAAASSWAIPSAAVAGVEPFDAEAKDRAIDVLALLGAPTPDAKLTRRVLLVSARGVRLRVLAHGDLALEYIAHRDLLPLPAALSDIAPLISHVAVADGKPTWFVVSAEQLLQSGSSVSRYSC